MNVPHGGLRSAGSPKVMVRTGHAKLVRMCASMRTYMYTFAVCRHRKAGVHGRDWAAADCTEAEELFVIP